ncbi:MAG: membrane protein insertion efficiency factor YidD [Ignavibacteria bacterium]|nr:membrane protein insertion efficiency factor YidD [Ignavibacteria bacterium]
MRLVLLFIARFYQTLISPALPFNHCRFVPSCSDYAAEAVEKHGAMRGIFLSVRRVLRCHPFHKHDVYDPVP